MFNTYQTLFLIYLIYRCKLGQFPDPLKVAKVSPVYKKGDREQPGNYRPISVLPVLSKIFEKLVNNRLIEYLEKNDILYKHQYGFREGRSTKLAVTNLINQLVHYQDEGESNCWSVC